MMSRGGTCVVESLISICAKHSHEATSLQKIFRIAKDNKTLQFAVQSIYVNDLINLPCFIMNPWVSIVSRVQQAYENSILLQNDLSNSLNLYKKLLTFITNWPSL